MIRLDAHTSGWPACIYIPHLTVGSAQWVSVENLGTKVSLSSYLFKYSYMIFIFTPNNHLQDILSGKAINIDSKRNSKLTFLSLPNNNLYGTIPLLSTSVGVLFLGFNGFSGTIPKQLTAMTDLIYLDLSKQKSIRSSSSSSIISSHSSFIIIIINY